MFQKLVIFDHKRNYRKEQKNRIVQGDPLFAVAVIKMDKCFDARA